MSVSAFVFYALAVLVLTGAVLSVTSRQIFRSAIFLLFSLMGVAGLYFWIGQEFLAAVQIIVYVGGIVVLIIFSIFLTQQAGTTLPCCGRRRMLFSGLATAAGAGFVLCQLLRFMPTGQAGSGMNDDMAAIGSQMLNTGASGYALPFEVISILLLAAMVGCIVIALKPTTETP